MQALAVSSDVETGRSTGARCGFSNPRSARARRARTRFLLALRRGTGSSRIGQEHKSAVSQPPAPETSAGDGPIYKISYSLSVRFRTVGQGHSDTVGFLFWESPKQYSSLSVAGSLSSRGQLMPNAPLDSVLPLPRNCPWPVAPRKSSPVSARISGRLSNQDRLANRSSPRREATGGCQLREFK